MEDALAPRAPHPYRRAGILLRLVLYPMALGLIALAWHEYHGSDAGPRRDSKLWSAVTSQGQPIRAHSSDGTLLAFDTDIVERCTDGSTFTFRWLPGVERFVQHGEDVRALSTGDTRSATGEPLWFENRASVHMGDHPSGTIRARAIRTYTRGNVPCASGDVTFDLRRSP